nr:hypothetical protein [uncultured Allomuricauda sp.]
MKLVRILVWCSISTTVCYFLVQAVAEQKIQNLIEQKLPEKFTLSYDNLRLNVFARSLTIEGILFKTNSQNALDTDFILTLDAITARKIDFITFINKGNLELDVLEVIAPNFKTIQHSLDKNNTNVEQDFPNIAIQSLYIREAKASYLNTSKKDTLLWLGSGMASLKNVQFNKEAPQMITLDTTAIEFNLDDLRFRLNAYEILRVESLQIASGSYTLLNSHLKTIYDWDTYSKKLYHQRDHYNLAIEKIEGFGLRWPIKNAKVGWISDSLSISSMDCNIFRDKTLPEETSTKTYFMESLSELDFPLHLAKISLANAKLSYFEKTEKSDAPQPLVFSSIQGGFANFSNQNNKGLKIHLKSKLMENAPLELKLETYTDKPMKSFVCTGTLYDFSAGDINPFLSTNMGVKTKGDVKELYFTMSGSRSGAIGDMKMKYDDFEFEVLKKDLLGVRKTTSFLLNLLVNRGNKTDENGYRYGDIRVEPESSKSFTNYLWLGIQDGLLDAVTGNGKKK